ncbi:MAG TPA: hypothetical protein DEQ64_17430 [Lachnoclostridium sp.]|uniref:hypothetical protein n=1 Tax=Lacrimispora sp. TaxID=2719234 RepID=UPI000ECC501A|nr:hypothetical protein [Lacrimispora sp.]HCD45473.1 hypothetical protein [Lachnoclostridium sp.]
MGRKRILLSWLICGLLFLFACFPVWADDNSPGGGTVPKRNGQTDIVAGVVVDYMGKLRFLVLDRDLNNPIAGVSVEIFIPSLNRYVLFGLTDSDGIYELDVAYNMASSISDSDQFIKNDKNYTFNGTLVYLNDNNIQYRVYKAGWLPYPHNGSYILKGEKVPETITIKLYQKKNGEDSDDKETVPDKTVPGGSFPGGTPLDKLPSDIPDKMPPLGYGGGTGTGGIPKTGVEGALLYWAFGFIFFLLAGGAIWKLSRLDNESKETKRRE